MSRSRLEFYSLGLGVALTLDRLDPSWKARYFEPGVWSDDLLREALDRVVDEKVVGRLDLSKPPFKVFLIDRVEGDRAALFMMVHHAVGDGVSFQSIVAALTDDTPTPVYAPPPRTRDERPPPAPLWLARSALRFRREAREAAALASERRATEIRLATESEAAELAARAEATRGVVARANRASDRLRRLARGGAPLIPLGAGV